MNERALMERPALSRATSSWRWLEATAVVLFFIHGVRVFFSVLFGVLYDTIFDEELTVNAVLCGVLIGPAFLAPLILQKRPSRHLMFGAAVLVAVARVPLAVNALTPRLYAGLALVAAGGTYLLALCRAYPRGLGIATILALLADQLLRAAGHTFDISLRAWWLPVQIALSIGLGVLAWWLFVRTTDRLPEGRVGLGHGLCLGAFLFLELNLLSMPGAAASWAELGRNGPEFYAVTLLVSLATAIGFSLRGRPKQLPRASGLAGLLVLAGALIGGHVLTGTSAAALLLLAQGAVVWLLPLPEVEPSSDEKDRSGLWLTLGLGLFLLLNVVLALSFVYAYTVEAFKGQGLTAYLTATLCLLLPRLLGREGASESLTSRWLRWAVPFSLFALTAIVGWIPRPVPASDVRTLGVGTYNIHYGYNTPWQVNLEAMARTIEESGAHIVALQEVDAGRITSYGVDNALWLGQRLRMYAHYQPTVEHLTGIGILSRFPVFEADARLLTGKGEPTAVLRIQVMVDEKPLNAYAIWMGLSPEERSRHLDGALPFIRAHGEPVVFGGDFNATPDSATYQRLVEAGFVDLYLASGADLASTSPAIQPRRRIDYVWGKGVQPVGGQVLDSLASDHRMVIVKVIVPAQAVQ